MKWSKSVLVDGWVLETSRVNYKFYFTEEHGGIILKMVREGLLDVDNDPKLMRLLSDQFVYKMGATNLKTAH